MTDFHFIRPLWLLALVPLTLLWFYTRYKSKQGGWNQLLSPHLAQFLLGHDQPGKSQRHTLLYPLLWLIATIALSGPSWQKQPLPLFELNSARVLMLDMSSSMLATDLTPNRLTQARYKAHDLLTDWQEGDSALIAYAAEAFVIAPLTGDSATLSSQLPALSPDIMPAQGSNPLNAITQGIELLQDAGYSKGQLVLFSDGIDTSQLDGIATIIKDSQWKLTIVGFGTPQGAPIELEKGQFLKQDGAIVMAALNDAELASFCMKSGCNYIRARADNQDILSLRQLLSPKSRSASAADNSAPSSEQQHFWHDGGIYFVYLLLPLALLLFYRQWLMLLLIIIIPAPSPVSATEHSNTPEAAIQQKANIGSALWHNQATRAQQAFDQGDFEQAANLYQTREWQAAALYRAGKYQQAASLYAKLNSADGFYNQGNSLAKQGEYKKAIAAYNDALSLDPELTAAQKNKALLEQLLQSQQEQQSDEQNRSEQQSGQQQRDKQNSAEQQPEQQQSDKQNSAEQQSEQQQSDKQNSAEQQSEQQQSDKQNSAEQQSGQQQSDKQNSAEQQSGQQQSDKQNSAEQQSGQQQSDKQNSAEQQSEQQQRDKQNLADQSKNQNEEKQALTEQQKQVLQQQAAQAQSPKDKAPESQPGGQVLQPQAPEQAPQDPDLKRLFRQLPDDPALLLKNRMYLEQRRRANRQQEMEQKW